MSTGGTGCNGFAPGGTACTWAGWLFGLLLIGIGVANLMLVHPVPALGYGLVSLLYLPPAVAALKRGSGVSIPAVLKVVLAIAVVMFTLGVSDLGDLID